MEIGGQAVNLIASVAGLGKVYNTITCSASFIQGLIEKVRREDPNAGIFLMENIAGLFYSIKFIAKHVKDHELGIQKKKFQKQ
jgi:hypothetical protein